MLHRWRLNFLLRDLWIIYSKEKKKTFTSLHEFHRNDSFKIVSRESKFQICLKNYLSSLRSNASFFSSSKKKAYLRCNTVRVLVEWSISLAESFRFQWRINISHISLHYWIIAFDIINVNKENEQHNFSLCSNSR